MKYLAKLKKIMLIVLLPFVSYGILGPLEIFFGNEKDFAFRYTDFAWSFIGISVLAWLLVSALLAILPEKVLGMVGALLLGLGTASYIQNMFMNIKLSEVDGSPMRWEELGVFPIVNILIWLIIVATVFAVYFFLKKYWDMFAMAVPGFLSAVQLIAAVSLLITASPADNGIELQVSGEKQFTVAPNENIIVFVLDTLGNTNLERMLDAYPDAIDGLKDFTFYDNADCHYYCTFPSMTHFLTGEDFDFEMQSQDWMRQAWESERASRFWSELKESDYSCRLFASEIGYVYGDINNLTVAFDNVEPMETTVKQGQLLSLFTKMSVYRYVPYLLKPGFEVLTKEFDEIVQYIDGGEITTDNGLFYQELKKQGLTIDESEQNALTIQHLAGIHQPYTLNADADIVEEASVEETTRGLMVIVDDYLQKLRDLGVYDQATIIITADHGAWYGDDTQPIFFIKGSNETHEELQVNTAPVSLDDFQATILEIIGKDYSQYGTSIYDWAEGDIRDRTVYMRMTDDAYPAIEGSSFNVYYQYSYSTNKEELNRKVGEGPEAVLPATPW